MNKEKTIKISKIISKTVLATAAIGGTVALISIFPSLPIALAPFVGEKRYYERERYYKQYSKQVIKYMRKKGLVKFMEGKGETMLKITKLGRSQLSMWQLEDFKIKKPKRWDKKWRIVIFDIPEKRRRHRNIMRDLLKNLGFLQLQQSTWVYPYKCEEIILTAAEEYRLLPFIVYIEAKYLGNDERMRKIFGV